MTLQYGPVTAAQRVARFVAEFDDVPEGVVAAAQLHVLDTLGCGLAALAMDEVAFVFDAVAETESAGPATAIGLADGLSPDDAALVNGTHFHALDYDDTHPDSVIHVSASTVAAGLAAGEVAGASGRDFIRAVVIGNEISIRVGMAAGGRFHARGFHPTGVCGVFGATATVARLRGLDARTTTNALGIAGSMAGGLMEFLADGAKTKPIHPGWAAHCALNAVRLAVHGATGPVTVLDGRRGFLGTYLHGEPYDIDGQVADLGSRWETPNIAFKPYPACHYIHAPLDALDSLVAEHALSAEDVASIVALSDETGVALVLDPPADKLAPRTVYDAKFSLPYCLGAMLVHGHVDVGSFNEDAIRDPSVLDVASRVTYELKTYASAPDAFPGGVRVRTTDGQTLEAELRHQRGGAENPMSSDDVIAKFRSNAGLALSSAEAQSLESAVVALEDQPDLEPMRMLRAARAATPR
jgi:2-methylcitrate dehydratase PrpD